MVKFIYSEIYINIYFLDLKTEQISMVFIYKYIYEEKKFVKLIISLEDKIKVYKYKDI